MNLKSFVLNEKRESISKFNNLTGAIILYNKRKDFIQLDADYIVIVFVIFAKFSISFIFMHYLHMECVVSK